MFKKIIALIIVLPILVVPLFCSCEGQAHADTGREHYDGFQGNHPATHDHADHDSSDSCNCHSFSTAAENTSTLQAVLLSFPNIFPTIDVLNLKSAIYLKSSMTPAYLGPPVGGSSLVPLYIQFHSLRI